VRTGPFGVTVFFVLSGFLITRILLENRNEAEADNHSRSFILQNFYIRRVLRIFPAYYFTLFLVAIFHNRVNLPFPNKELVANLSYTSNFYVYRIQSWPPLTPHFWSLAVEEQFYLVWPLIMLFTPKKYLLYLISLFVGIGITSQCLASDPEFSYVLPQTCLDALGLGGLLAWIVVYKPGRLSRTYLLISIAAICSLLIMTLDWFGLEFYHQWRILYSIIGAWMTCYILVNQHNQTTILTILNNSILIKIGKVSYGMYLYHVLFFYLFWSKTMELFYRFIPFIKTNYYPYLFFVMNGCLLYFLCWLSWTLLEKPILDLKRLFTYQDKTSRKQKAMLKIERAGLNN
jgi:peptidoglycan/LPS O-acetylase OafA/YrhL